MTTEIRTIVIAGSGNVAWHLGKKLYEKGFEILQVFGRNEKTAVELAAEVHAEVTTKAEYIKPGADAYIISVSDGATESTAGLIKPGKGIVVHTAGSLGINVLKAHASNYGVLYPLQTFTRARVIDFSEVPFFIEAGDPVTLSAIRKLASELSPRVYEAGSDERMKLHLAAVFASNFTNHMYVLADLILEEGIPFDVLSSLIRETAEKALSLSPRKAQTGPAVRNDTNVMELHKKLLRKYPQIKEIYETVSSSILKLKG